MSENLTTSSAVGATQPTLAREVSTAIETAITSGIIDRRDVCDDFLRRSRMAFRKNLRETGDCENDRPLLLGLAIAQAKVEVGPGWIPEVQRIGCLIAAAPALLAALEQIELDCEAGLECISDPLLKQIHTALALARP